MYKEGVVMSELEPLHQFSALTTSSSYNSIELFAGAGGMALGMEKAGFNHLLLNDFDRYATQTLQLNRPHWNIIHGDIAEIDFTSYHNIDLLTGGFPCQAFSYAGKKRGLEDTRGTLFYEFARALKESQPKLFLAENVKGLKNHDGGRTLQTMIEVFTSMGIHYLHPKYSKVFTTVYLKSVNGFLL